jgi:membrane-bound lytic murein transglycosylase B
VQITRSFILTRPRPAAIRTRLLSRQVASRAFLTTLLILTLTGSSIAAPKKKQAEASPSYEGREEIVDFSQEWAVRAGLDAETIRNVLAQARRVEAVRRAIMPLPPGQKKNWSVYRSRFIDATRIAAGVKFWNENADALARAEQQYGVPQSIIVGLIGVETIYGRNMGSFRVIDALTTLAFDFPHGRSNRSAYFRDQLGYFLKWTAAEGYDPLSIKGSYAGAIGLGQFMPESILQHAVDFDGDKHIDLSANAADAIGSVAKYLADFGWVRGLPASLMAGFDRANLQKLLEPDIVPTFTTKDLLDNGVELKEGMPAGEKFAVIELQNGDLRSDLSVGTRNFYVITRYNRSSYYAMSVIDLAREVEAARRTLAQVSAPAASPAPATAVSVPASAPVDAASTPSSAPAGAAPAASAAEPAK